ncbi:hypothetical protein [Burkholderia contaminans]|uniref:hypothetical protein n=1 Tax=Burkholderia contaminans TaxID=488447 RepID=UPI00158281A7|nr:hypothetical protein [Burkholderia contaminans]
MLTFKATDPARRTNQVSDVPARGEAVTITRNDTMVATIQPPARAVPPREASGCFPMSSGTAERYKADIRSVDFDSQVRDPWLQ